MLSIIVPVYNVEKYLEDCLRSLETQTSNNFEVIIVNDGSTDGCQDIIDEYCLRNKNFSCYYKENGGLMSAYLLGIEKANGDYIGFVDSDDYVEPTFVEKMYDFNSNNADVVICDRIDLYEDGSMSFGDVSPLIPFGYYNENNNEIVYKHILPPFSGKHISNARWNKIFKKSIVLSNLKYCESKSRIMEDRFFTPSCMFTAKTFMFIADKLYYYRQRKSGSNHSMASPKLLDAIRLLINTQKSMLEDKGIFKLLQNEFESACLNYMGLYIERNLLIRQKFKQRLKYSRELINDKYFKLLVKKHKKELKHKKGFAIRISYFFRSPFVLSILSCLFGGK